MEDTWKLRIQPPKNQFDQSHSRHRNAGCAFTMVEVIVALAILGTTIVAVFGAMSQCARAAHHARLLTRSVLLAETLLAEVKTSQNIAFETRQGQQDPYSWEVQVAPTPIENLAAVRVEVNWLEQQRTQQYQLLSLIYVESTVKGQ